MAKKIKERKREYYLAVLGRTLEHLGVQNYKRRDVAIAELVANCWDAGASEVYIEVPIEEDYDKDKGEISITDNGIGMDENEVQDAYLIVGRNRRTEGEEGGKNRLVMGRKGIGKLAGFGIAQTMALVTWRDSIATTIELDLQALKVGDGSTQDIPIEGVVGSVPADVEFSSGTKVVLRNLKHSSPLGIEMLHQALARRYSRTVKGEMKIKINGKMLRELEFDFESRVPDGNDLLEEEISEGNSVRYYYGFTKKPHRFSQLRGFTIYVRGKTAQAPPYFFDVEGSASGQHGTKYLTGEIEADFLDVGVEDETDLISTDRQEFDWEDDQLSRLHDWGAELTRKALRERLDRRGEETENLILSNEEIASRITLLDEASRRQITPFLRSIGATEADEDQTINLADGLLRAYEYRQFHDVVSEIEDVKDNPEGLVALLTHLREWKVLESRAILEIVKGRIEIIEKFYSMIVNDAPETAPSEGADNMHDLIARYPWLLHPEWQVLAEERTITKQLQEWNAKDIEDPVIRQRYDFIALTDEKKLVVIEIKRSGHAVTFEELQRLATYKNKLSKGHDKELIMIMICSSLDVDDATQKVWDEREDGDIWYWGEVHERTARYYSHYRAILEGDVKSKDFFEKEREVAQTREVIKKGSSHRGKKGRKAGLGPQDVKYESKDKEDK